MNELYTFKDKHGFIAIQLSDIKCIRLDKLHYNVEIYLKSNYFSAYFSNSMEAEFKALQLTNRWKAYMKSKGVKITSEKDF